MYHNFIIILRFYFDLYKFQVPASLIEGLYVILKELELVSAALTIQASVFFIFVRYCFFFYFLFYVVMLI